jgi:hypothetical protein
VLDGTSFPWQISGPYPPTFRRHLQGTSGQSTITVAILGTDTVLAARPATAIQLAHAVLAVGYDAVYPASWGDELVAAGCLQRLSERNGAPVVLCACPLVAQRLMRTGGELKRFMMCVVSPPVAVARYLRALHSGRRLHITYLGACPDAEAAEIDARLAPAELEAELRSRRIVVTRQAQYFESVLPPDRRRFYSLPGGAPAPNWLGAAGSERRLTTLQGEDLAAELAQTLLAGGSPLVDPAPMLGCVCSGAAYDADVATARDQAERMDPPRAASPVVDTSLPIELDRELPESAWPHGGWDRYDDDHEEGRAIAGVSEERGNDRQNRDRDSRASYDSSPPSPNRSAETAHPQSTGDADTHTVGGVVDHDEVLHSFSRDSDEEAPATERVPVADPVQFEEMLAAVHPPPPPPPIKWLAPAANDTSIELALEALHDVQLVPSVQDLAPPLPSLWDTLLDQSASVGNETSRREPVVVEPTEAATRAAEPIAAPAPATEEAGEPAQTDAPDAAASKEDQKSEVEEGAKQTTRGSVRRITPTSIRRIASSTPTMRTGSGRSVPRAYAAHRRTPPGGAPRERELDIRRSFEPIAPPADFSPPLPPRAVSAPPRNTAPADRTAPSSARDARETAAPAAAARAAASADRSMTPRPSGMVPHRTLAIPMNSRPRAFGPPRPSPSRSRSVLIAVAVLAVSALTFLAVRHFTLREADAQLDAATVMEQNGVVDAEPVSPPALSPVEVRASEPAAPVDTALPPAAGPAPTTPSPAGRRTAVPRAPAATASPAPDRESELRLRQFDSVVRALDAQRAHDP